MHNLYLVIQDYFVYAYAGGFFNTLKNIRFIKILDVDHISNIEKIFIKHYHLCLTT